MSSLKKERVKYKRKWNNSEREIQVKPKAISKLNAGVLWLSTTGLLAVIVNFAFGFFTGSLDLEYLGEAGRGYKFQLSNNSSTTQKIESFRVIPDFNQKFLFKITEDVVGTFTDEGVSIPGGPESSIPAYEYRGIDGTDIAPGESIEFRVPPLTSRYYMKPESMAVDIEIKAISNNKVMHELENILADIGIRDNKKILKYLVSENYWSPLGNTEFRDAVSAACRDDDSLAKSSICKDAGKG